jgi:hypothetical protein
MPFNNYAPQYIFKGQVQSDTAPSANNDLVRKQDVSGLSFISSIASGSSSYLSVNASGELSVESLLISDVTVNGTETSLANFISNESSAAAALKKGDFLVLTAATGGAETYIVSGADGSVAGNYTQVESGLTSAEIVAHLSGGTGINIAANGTISFNGDTDDVSEGSTNLYYTQARFNSAFGAKSTSDLSEGSNLYYTDARSRAAVSAESGGCLLYASATGQFRISISNSGGLSTSGALAVQYDNSTIGLNGSNQLEFKGDSDDVSEGSSNLYFTDARARGAFSAGAGITISGAGEIASSITQYTDSNARAAVSGGDGLDYNSSTGVFSLDLKANSGLAIDAGELKVELGEGLGFAPDGVIEVETGAGLEIDSGDQSVKVDDDYFRKEFTAQSFTANTAKTINHALGKKYVHVSVYDSSDNLVHAEVSLTDANNLTVTTSDALTGVTVVVSI